MSGTITYKVGDLFEATEDAIAHGCNCAGVMGAGVAALVKAHHPKAYMEYRDAIGDGAFHIGAAQSVFVGATYDLQATVDPPVKRPEWVYNLGTQQRPGPDATEWGIFLSFANMLEDALFRGIHTIAIPRIGAGIGGLLWDTEVEPAIQEALDRSRTNIDIVVYDLP